MTSDEFRKKFRRFAAGLLFTGAMIGAGSATAGTLDQVRQRGTLNCGVSQGLYGFSERNAAGEWTGFDVDFCRAVAAAILDDAKKVTFVPLSATERFDALKAGKIDVLSRNSTWTLEREAGLGLLFAGVNFYDGQAFMVRRDRNIVSSLALECELGVDDPVTTLTNSGMPRRAPRKRGEAGIQIQLRLDGVQVAWLDEKVAEFDAPSRSALVSTVFKLHIQAEQSVEE